MKNEIKLKNIKMKLYFLLILINIILLFVTYKVMPIIQNYPPNSENIVFQKSVEALSHVEQYSLIFIIGTGLELLALNISLKNISKFIKKYNSKERIDYEEIKRVRKDCINAPYKFYLIQILIVLILGITLTLLLISDGLAILKFFLMLFAITSLIEILQFIIIQRELKKVLILTYHYNDNYEKNNGFRISFSSNLILQIIPFIAVSIIIISLVSYAKATEEYASSNENYYKVYMENIQYKNLDINEIKEQLNNVPLYKEGDYFFITSTNYDNTYISKKGEEITDFFKKYIDFYFSGDSGIVYEFYGNEEQAYTMKVIDKYNNKWYVGFEYSTTNQKLMTYYISIILTTIIAYTLFIYILAKNISNNIVNVSNSLEYILEKETGKEKGKRKLPILSNDEIGDLSYYYNKIKELTEKNEQELKDNEYVMQRQAQFAILGEFAGGIAHDLNSPLSAIQSNISTLNKYFTHNRVQAEAEDMEEMISILKNIDSSIDRMSNTIAGVRNQIRATGDKDKEEFSLKELIDGIEILFGSILRKNNCQIINKVNPEYSIYGEKNKLDRVVGNVIKNSIDAYQEIGKSGTIEVDVLNKNNKYIISIKDEAGGISSEIKDVLFKKMKTTKQENGTGFGLYYSNTVIESSFGGKMSFETKAGIGTTFFIELPIIKEEKK